MLLECTVLQQSCDEYYTVDSLRTLFEKIPEACIIEFLREAGFFYLMLMAIYPIQLFIQISHQLTTLSSWINPHYWTPPLEFVYRAQAAMGEPYLWMTANMSRRTCVVVKRIQSNLWWASMDSLLALLQSFWGRSLVSVKKGNGIEFGWMGWNCRVFGLH